MNPTLRRLRNRLVEEAKRRLKQPKQFVHFTHHLEADRILNDLENFPHAFVIACIADRQIKSEKAWLIPYELKRRIGSFSIGRLAKMKIGDFKNVMRRPSPLHRFPDDMAENIFYAIQHIVHHYDGDAKKIWNDRPASATLVRRFLEFRGVGPKIATMATNILVRYFRVPLSDYYSVDISVDVQIKRVFSRMGFVPKEAKADYIIYRARELWPEYPGIFDVVLWELGRTVCRPQEPKCQECPWARLCSYPNKKQSAHGT